MTRILISFFFLQFNSFLIAQTIVDSLIAVYPTQKSSERAQTLGNLCYELAYNDTKRSIYYGKLGYASAKSSKDSAIIAQALNDWSIPYLIKGDFDSVLVLCDEALGIRTKLGDSIGTAKLLSKMANANYELGNLSTSLKQNLRALSIFEANGLGALAGRVCANIGSVYEQNGMLEDGLKMYQRAKKIAKENENWSAYHSALLAEGTCIAKLNRFQEADDKLNEALVYYKEEDNIDMIGTCYQNLGFNARLNKQSSKGEFYYKKALEMYRENENESATSLILANLAQVSLDLKLFDAAENYLSEAMTIAHKTNSLFLLENGYRGLIRLENLKGDYQKADEYFELFTATMDSIYNKETNYAISEMKVKYDTDEQTRKLENEKLVNKNNRLLLFLALGLIAILILIILLIRHRKKIQSERLEIQGLKNLEIERRRIARDLHDNLGAELVLISSKIDAFSFKNTDAEVNRILEGIETISSNANHQLRETIWSIHKSSISLEELASKVSSYAQRVSENSAIEISVNNTSENAELLPSSGLHLFRICQEMTNNTLKYAAATTITIEFGANQMTFSDNGIGFDVEKVRRGYGLNNIEERVKELGGTISWRSENGTHLQLTF